jgi:hypothetical protein
MILALCLLPFTFIQNVEVVNKERFPIVIGITLAVTIAYWVSYAIIEKKRREQNGGK